MSVELANCVHNTVVKIVLISVVIPPVAWVMMISNGQNKWHDSSKALWHVWRYIRRIYNFGFVYTMLKHSVHSEHQNMT